MAKFAMQLQSIGMVLARVLERYLITIYGARVIRYTLTKPKSDKNSKYVLISFVALYIACKCITRKQIYFLKF